jgi:two-component system CheB/CheR fusion protein
MRKNNSLAKDRRIKKLELELAAHAIHVTENRKLLPKNCSANEEVVSSNEELQTVNEELEIKRRNRICQRRTHYQSGTPYTQRSIATKHDYSEALFATIHVLSVR